MATLTPDNKVQLFELSEQGDIGARGYETNASAAATALAAAVAAQASSNAIEVGSNGQVLNVVLASTANIAALTGLGAIDGVTPTDGQFMLLKDQSTASQNGVYAAHSGAWTKQTLSGVSIQVAVAAGTVNGGTVWEQQSSTPTFLRLMRAKDIRIVTGIAAGLAAPGAITLAGAVVGDKVIMATDVAAVVDRRAYFEATITVAGQIQQIQASDLHLVSYQFMLQAQA